MVFNPNQPLKQDYFPSILNQIKTDRAATDLAKVLVQDSLDIHQKKQLEHSDLSGVELPEGMEEDLTHLKQELFTTKMAEQEIFAQSAAEGGPSTPQGAIQNLMDYGKVGYRRLSVLTKVPRKKLVRMIEGQIDMPGEVSNTIIEYFEKTLPHLFK